MMVARDLTDLRQASAGTCLERVFRPKADDSDGRVKEADCHKGCAYTALGHWRHIQGLNLSPQRFDACL